VCSEAWTTFGPLLVHVIQLFYCRLFTRFLICLIKFVEIWLNFLYIYIHVKHDIVSLIVCNIMCTNSPNTFTLLLKKSLVRSTELLQLFALCKHSRCWHVWNTCYDSGVVMGGGGKGGGQLPRIRNGGRRKKKRCGSFLNLLMFVGSHITDEHKGFAPCVPHPFMIIGLTCHWRMWIC
jgi:hypothetical protein